MSQSFETAKTGDFLKCTRTYPQSRIYTVGKSYRIVGERAGYVGVTGDNKKLQWINIKYGKSLFDLIPQSPLTESEKTSDELEIPEIDLYLVKRLKHLITQGSSLENMARIHELGLIITKLGEIEDQEAQKKPPDKAAGAVRWNLLLQLPYQIDANRDVLVPDKLFFSKCITTGRCHWPVNPDIRASCVLRYKERHFLTHF